MGAFKITNMGDGSADDDAATFGQVSRLVRAAPVTKTANFTVADTDITLINNKAGSSCNVTLPDATTNIGRELNFVNYQGFSVVSVAFNVKPVNGGGLGISLLPAIAGAWCTVVSDGTNWIMIRSGLS